MTNLFRLASVLTVLFAGRRLEWKTLANTGALSDANDVSLGQILPDSAVRVMIAITPAASVSTVKVYLWISKLGQWVLAPAIGELFAGTTTEGSIERISPAGATAIYVDAGGEPVHVGYSILE